jgi:hypothetical protein
MNKWKPLSWLFILLSFGALKETHRILTSQAPDITRDRSGLAIMAGVITLIFVWLAFRFWKKASEV